MQGLWRPAPLSHHVCTPLDCVTLLPSIPSHHASGYTQGLWSPLSLIMYALHAVVFRFCYVHLGIPPAKATARAAQLWGVELAVNAALEGVLWVVSRCPRADHAQHTARDVARHPFALVLDSLRDIQPLPPGQPMHYESVTTHAAVASIKVCMLARSSPASQTSHRISIQLPHSSTDFPPPLTRPHCRNMRGS